MGRRIQDRPMKISIAATNPCHLFPLALELDRLGALGCYYSGYPAWKLAAPAAMPVRTHSFRTTVVYGALKTVPAALRPSPRALFLWQDHGFDAWVGRNLEPCDFLHAMPGQALRAFSRARKLGVATVLNHATGPVREWVRIMAPEYERAGLRLEDVCPYDDAYFSREATEYELADFHCAASTVVRDQLIATGIPPNRIWLAGYGADPAIFHAKDRGAPRGFRILFAGQLGLRKGLRTLLEAVASCKRPDWELHFYGGEAPEAAGDLAAYRGSTPMTRHGSVSQPELAEAMRQASVLVLPSLEEGFGLVIPQALNCGAPCIVSDRVGGKDLIRHHENGSIFPCNASEALAAELIWWETNWKPVSEFYGWRQPAEAILRAGQAAG